MNESAKTKHCICISTLILFPAQSNSLTISIHLYLVLNRIRQLSTNLYDNLELAHSNRLRSNRPFHSARIVNRSQKFVILEGSSKIIKFHRSLRRLLRSNGVAGDLGRFVQVSPNVAAPQQHSVPMRSVRYVLRTLPAILGNLGEGE